MADMHVLETVGGAARVIMHIAVPDAVNDVGVNYREALVNSGLGGSTKLTEGTASGEITTAEKALVESGAVVELERIIEIEGVGQTNAGRQALLRSAYTTLAVNAIAELQVQLKFFGHTESEE